VRQKPTANNAYKSCRQSLIININLDCRHALYANVGSHFLRSSDQMEIVDQETKDKVLSKITRHLNISHYYDIHELSDEQFTDKYGYWGVGQENFLEVRFYPETNGLTQLKKLLSQEDEYFILPIDKDRKIFKDKISHIDTLFNDHRQAHVIILDIKFNWLVIKNEFNKLIGMGDQIKKKMAKKIHMSFDSERIMYSTTDEKAEEGQPNK
jgi:hypothetical protein